MAKLICIFLAVAVFAFCDAIPAAQELRDLLKALESVAYDEEAFREASKGGALIPIEKGGADFPSEVKGGANKPSEEDLKVEELEEKDEPINLKAEPIALKSWYTCKSSTTCGKKGSPPSSSSSSSSGSSWGGSSSSWWWKELEDKIVGGSYSTIEELPWQVYLMVNDKAPSPGYRYDTYGACGGTIIHENWILTASHCFSNRAGNLNSQGKMYDHYVRVNYGGTSRSDGSMTQVVGDEVYVHKDFSFGTLKNDIALIYLKTPLTFGSGVQAACLRDDTAKVETGSECTVSGWGTTSSGGSTPDKLKETTVPILADCINNRGVDLTTQLCAGNKPSWSPTDSCQGDSGGPLACPDNNAYYVEGVVSYGDGCAKRDLPGVYTRVSAFKDWIQDRIHGACYKR